MTKLELFKLTASFVVGSTTAKVVKEIIQNNTDPATVSDKTAVAVGSYVLGAIAAGAAKEWTDAKIDELVASIQKLRQGKLG